MARSVDLGRTHGARRSRLLYGTRERIAGRSTGRPEAWCSRGARLGQRDDRRLGARRHHGRDDHGPLARARLRARHPGDLAGRRPSAGRRSASSPTASCPSSSPRSPSRPPARGGRGRGRRDRSGSRWEPARSRWRCRGCAIPVMAALSRRATILVVLLNLALGLDRRPQGGPRALTEREAPAASVRAKLLRDGRGAAASREPRRRRAERRRHPLLRAREAGRVADRRHALGRDPARSRGARVGREEGAPQTTSGAR